MITTIIHHDYAHQKLAGQPNYFAVWARKVIKELTVIAPKIAVQLDLSNMTDCDHLWIHYEAKRSPADAALEVAAGRWH